MKRAVRLALLLLLPSLASCGYHLAGRGSFLPATIKTLGIPPFDSAVPRQDLPTQRTDAVPREFLRRGGYAIVPRAEGADAVLIGRLSGLIVTPIAVDESGRQTRALITITAGVTLRDVRENRTLYENAAFQFRTELEPGQDDTD